MAAIAAFFRLPGRIWSIEHKVLLTESLALCSKVTYQRSRYRESPDSQLWKICRANIGPFRGGFLTITYLHPHNFNTSTTTLQKSKQIPRRITGILGLEAVRSNAPV